MKAGFRPFPIIRPCSAGEGCLQIKGIMGIGTVCHLVVMINVWWMMGDALWVLIAGGGWLIVMGVCWFGDRCYLKMLILLNTIVRSNLSSQLRLRRRASIIRPKSRSVKYRFPAMSEQNMAIWSKHLLVEELSVELTSKQLPKTSWKIVHCHWNF